MDFKQLELVQKKMEEYKTIENFETLGLIVNDKPISKTKFKQLATVYTYGRGRNNLKCVYFYTNPKEMMYQFCGLWAGDTKKEVLDYAYDNFIKITQGDWSPWVDEDVNFGNSGLPIGYAKIYTKNRNYGI